MLLVCDELCLFGLQNDAACYIACVVIGSCSGGLRGSMLGGFVKPLPTRKLGLQKRLPGGR